VKRATALLGAATCLGCVAATDSPPAVGGTSQGVYFSAGEGGDAPQLWRTDGTAAGTGLVTGGLPGGEASSPDDLSVVGGQLFFSGYPGALWKTDGTAAGTLLVKLLGQTGPVVGCGGKGFFAASGSANDSEPWMTDGTPAGTALVADVQPGPYGSFPQMLACLGTTLLFSADDGVHGRELWRTDGTAAGTSLVKDVYPGTTAGIWSHWARPIVFGGALYFSALDPDHGFELWRTDGTEAGTLLVKDVNPGPGSSALLGGNAVFEGVLYFVGDDGTHGPEPWKTDGTDAGTALVKDVYPGSVGSYPDGFAVFGGALYFSATDDVHGGELWRTDGTAAGTVLVRDICPGTCGSGAQGMTAGPGALFFGADDGVHGVEPWKTDGTAGGTAMVKDLFAGAPGSSPYGFTALDGKVFFGAATGATGGQLWKTDAGTVRVPQACSSADGCYALGGFTRF
jgi:ELWxxDGT repeat protein